MRIFGEGVLPDCRCGHRAQSHGIRPIILACTLISPPPPRRRNMMPSSPCWWPLAGHHYVELNWLVLAGDCAGATRPLSFKRSCRWILCFAGSHQPAWHQTNMLTAGEVEPSDAPRDGAAAATAASLAPQTPRVANAPLPPPSETTPVRAGVINLETEWRRHPRQTAPDPAGDPCPSPPNRTPGGSPFEAKAAWRPRHPAVACDL